MHLSGSLVWIVADVSDVQSRSRDQTPPRHGPDARQLDNSITRHDIFVNRFRAPVQ